MQKGNLGRMWGPRRAGAWPSLAIAAMPVWIWRKGCRPGKKEVVQSLSIPVPNKSFWDERYGTEEFMYGKEPNDFLRENIDSLPQGTVLCLADGEGRNSVFIASTGRSVWSVDLSSQGPIKTLRLAAERGVEVHADSADLANYDLGENRWDAIVSIFAHMPKDIRASLHQRVVRALKPSGVFLLEAYTPSQVGRGTGGPQDPSLTMNLGDLQKELSPLIFSTAHEIERKVVEGFGHTGMASVVQVIARKG